MIGLNILKIIEAYHSIIYLQLQLINEPNLKREIIFVKQFKFETIAQIAKLV